MATLRMGIDPNITRYIENRIRHNNMPTDIEQFKSLAVIYLIADHLKEHGPDENVADWALRPVRQEE